uniref:Uncharacterized protein n=1 Tax=Rhizophora mucronata TaxID=61149 RepID=A0A2P2PVC6_RHIMU
MIYNVKMVSLLDPLHSKSYHFLKIKFHIYSRGDHYRT